jgi:arsenate reductase
MAGGRQCVLVLCTGNSARSQMLEAILNDRLGERVVAHSAGVEPAERVHPLALRALEEAGIRHDPPPPKTPDALAGTLFDVVITVCDHAKESCPVFPGAPVQLHMGYPDPAAAAGTEEERLNAFRQVRDHMLAWTDLCRRL